MIPKRTIPRRMGRGRSTTRGEGLDLGPDRDELFALKGGVQEYPLGVDPESDQPEGEEHRQVHRRTARNSGQDRSRVGYLHLRHLQSNPGKSQGESRGERCLCMCMCAQKYIYFAFRSSSIGSF